MNKTIYNIFKKHSLPRKLVLVTDLVITSLAFLLANVIRFNLNVGMVSLDQILIQFTCIFGPIYLIAFLVTGSYRGIIRHSSVEDLARLFSAISMAVIPVMGIAWVTHLTSTSDLWMIPYSVPLIHGMVTLVLLMAFRLGVRGTYQTYANPSRCASCSALIFGAGELGQITCNVLENDSYSKIKVAGFIDDKKSLEGKELSGKPIYSECQAFKRFINTKKVDEIILAISKNVIDPNRKKRIS
ncbi:MAG: nucleoside-diphosphate sugar epimerase/dehydratase [Mangrovibacterium sp.]